MKSTRMLIILVLRSELLRRVALVVVLASASMAHGGQSLTVNNQPLDSITLKVGQTCTVEVVSDDSNPYNAYVGFDDGLVLGTFSWLETKKKAGDLADATEYDVPAFYGYFIVSAGSLPPPSPGVHFIFQYTAQQLGETDLKLYDEILTSVRDSVHITVVPAEMGTAFTYQGRLLDANDAANGLYDFEFELYDAPSDGNQLGSTIDINDLDVIDGYFTVELDYGSVYDGNGVWLEIGVRPAGTGSFTILSPLQEVKPTPYSIHATHALQADEADTLNGLDSSAFALVAHSHDGVYALIGHIHSGSDIMAGTISGSHIMAGTITDDLIVASIARDSEITWGNLADIPVDFADGIDNIGGTGDITAVNAGTGLIGGGTSGDVTLGVQVPLSLSGSSSGGIISGTNSYSFGGHGVYGYASGNSGRGVYGEASNSGDYTNYGGYFVANGTSGWGVYGSASGRSGRGVYGYATGESGKGVRGYASGSSGWGVQGYGGAYDFFADGPGTNYGSSSSIRWKRDVQPIDDPLEKVLRLRGVYFNWDAEHGGEHDVGMIAEEVGEVLPEIVEYEENGIDASGMDYGMLAPLLVEAVKALKTQADEREKQLAKKIVEIAELNERLLALEACVAKLTISKEGGL